MSKKYQHGLKVADFFCGAGGFSEGFRQNGYDIVFGLDFWKPALDTHLLNHPNCHHEKMNILDLDTPDKIDKFVPDTEIIIGSPPCVSFSGSNKAGKADKTLGIMLIESYLRIVAWKKNKPGSILKYWCMENVPNSEPYVKKDYSGKELGLSGSNIHLDIPSRALLNAADFGTPQTRTRFICGNYPIPIRSHKEEEWITIKQVNGSLTDPLSDERPKSIKDPCYDIKIPSKDLTDHFYDTSVEDFEWKSALRMKRDHGYMGKMSFPEDENRPSRTILATMSSSTREAMILGGRKNENGEWTSYRMPTIREIATFMSFPITYQFDGSNESIKYKLVGNAVCPRKASAIARNILEEEEIETPKDFIELPKNLPSVDLNGRPYIPKLPKPKRIEAKFSMHIPNLKSNGMRVDLTNRFSDFDNERFRWDCILHNGVGKDAKYSLIDQNKIKRIVQSRLIDGFEEFEKELNETFQGRIPTAKGFQEKYCLIGSNDGSYGPEDVLEKIKSIIDSHYPEKYYSDHTIEGSGKELGIPNRNSISLRILLGVYSCNEVVGMINAAELDQ